MKACHLSIPKPKISEPMSGNIFDIAYNRLAVYAALMDDRYKPASFHLEIAKALEAVEAGKLKRLIISMPPGHGKSKLAVNAFVSWYLGRNPTREVIFATYNQDFATRAGRALRNVFTDSTFQAIFPGVTLADDSQSAQLFNVVSKGQRKQGQFLAAGAGGTITGMRGHLLLIDDPIKNMEEANSVTIREGLKEWYTSTFLSRQYGEKDADGNAVEPVGEDYEQSAIVIIGTRWHEDDLIGYVLREHAHEGWVNLVYPAINDEGQPLWPQRYGLKFLENMKKSQPPRHWYALYQQQPRIEDGNIFRKSWFRLYPYGRRLPNFDYVVQSYDTAFTTRAGSDYTAYTCWGMFNARAEFGDPDMPEWGALLLDARKDNMDFVQLRKFAADKYNNGFGRNGRKTDVVLIEAKASGISLLQEMKHTGLPIAVPRLGREDKKARALSVQHFFELGYVWVPESGRERGQINRNLDEYIQEMIGFDRAKHDDYVDSTVHALRYLSDMDWVSAPRLVHYDEDEMDMIETTVVNPYGI